MSNAAFFESVRVNLFQGVLMQSQVDGINALLGAWAIMGDGDARKLAYVLATAYHETAQTMAPIGEYGKGVGHPYGAIDATGKAPYGRGYVQLTWAANYQKADKALGLSGALARNYDLALDPVIAAKVILRGMLEGWFSGKKLADYFNAHADWVGARAIVNGSDRATEIANYAMKFYIAALLLGTSVPGQSTPPAAKPPSFWQTLLAALIALFSRKV